MSFSSQNASEIELKIHIFPGDEKFNYSFDKSKSFGDLRKELEENNKIKKDNYYIQMDGHIMNDDMTIKDNEVINNSDINIVNNRYVKIDIKLNNPEDEPDKLQLYMLMSDFKVIKADENKIIKVCEYYFIFILFCIFNFNDFYCMFKE